MIAGRRSTWTRFAEGGLGGAVHRTDFVARLRAQDWTHGQGGLLWHGRHLSHAARSRVRADARGPQDTHQAGKHGRRTRQTRRSAFQAQLDPGDRDGSAKRI